MVFEAFSHLMSSVMFAKEITLWSGAPPSLLEKVSALKTPHLLTFWSLLSVSSSPSSQSSQKDFALLFTIIV